MKEVICPCCGRKNIITDNFSCCCKYCSVPLIYESLNNKLEESILMEAHSLRLNKEFKKATLKYEELLKVNRQVAGSYFGLFLCDYEANVNFDDEKKTTVLSCDLINELNPQFNDNYLEAMTLALPQVKPYFEDIMFKVKVEEANLIKLLNDEEDYDIFLKTTEIASDLNLARDLYNTLNDLGYKVYYSKETLKNKDANSFEPVILKAIKTCKALILIGDNKTLKEDEKTIKAVKRYNRLVRKDKNLIIISNEIMEDELPRSLKPIIFHDYNSCFKPDLINELQDIFNYEVKDNYNSEVLKLYEDFSQLIDEDKFSEALKVKKEIEKLTNDCFMMYEKEFNYLLGCKDLLEAINKFFKGNQVLPCLINYQNLFPNPKYQKSILDQVHAMDLFVKMCEYWDRTKYISEKAYLTIQNFDKTLIKDYFDYLTLGYDIIPVIEKNYETNALEIVNMAFDNHTKIGEYTKNHALSEEELDSTMKAAIVFFTECRKSKFFYYYQNYAGYLEYLGKEFVRSKDYVILPAYHIYIGDEIYRLTKSEAVLEETYEDYYNLLVKANDKDWGTLKYNPNHELSDPKPIITHILETTRVIAYDKEKLLEMEERYFSYECKKQIRIMIDVFNDAKETGILRNYSNKFITCSKDNYEINALKVYEALKTILDTYFKENHKYVYKEENILNPPLVIQNALLDLESSGSDYYANEILDIFYDRRKKQVKKYQKENYIESYKHKKGKEVLKPKVSSIILEALSLVGCDLIISGFINIMFKVNFLKLLLVVTLGLVLFEVIRLISYLINVKKNKKA